LAERGLPSCGAILTFTRNANSQWPIANSF
jgi:hypothetical protein